MKTFKATTRKGMELIDRYNNFEGVRLEDVYGTVSSAKASAYEDCRRWCAEENGENFHICSHNTFQFSVAWKTAYGYRIETATNTYKVLV